MVLFAGNYAVIKETSLTIYEETSGYITFDITRLGLEDGGDFYVHLEPISDVILSVGDANYFSNMNILEALEGDFPFSLHSWAVSGTPFQFILSIDNGNYELDDTITKVYGEAVTIFEDNCNTMTYWISQYWDVAQHQVITHLLEP